MSLRWNWSHRCDCCSSTNLDSRIIWEHRLSRRIFILIVSIEIKNIDRIANNSFEWIPFGCWNYGTIKSLSSLWYHTIHKLDKQRSLLLDHLDSSVSISSLRNSRNVFHHTKFINLVALNSIDIFTWYHNPYGSILDPCRTIVDHFPAKHLVKLSQTYSLSIGTDFLTFHSSCLDVLDGFAYHSSLSKNVAKMFKKFLWAKSDSNRSSINCENITIKSNKNF